MPLTFAHPAAVLPLARWLPLSALVIGAMMPDVPYFLPLADDRFGHTLAGLFWFCVPAGVLFLVAFHLVVKRPLTGLAPRGAQERLAPVADRFRVASAADAGRVAAALLVGAASHVVWDSFTHRSGWGVGLAPALDTVVALGPLRIEAYRAAQHASTLIGLSILGIAAARWWRTAPRRPVPVRPVWSRLWRLGALVGVSVAVGVARTVTTPNLGLAQQARFFLVGTTSTLVACLVLYGVLSRLGGRTRRGARTER